MLIILPLVLLGCTARPEPPPAPVLLPEADRIAAPPAPPVPDEAPATATALPPAASPAAAEATAAPPSEERALAYTARRPKSVIELQQWRTSSTVAIPGPDGPLLTATLVDLNPWAHEWFVVQLDWASGPQQIYHLENPDPTRVAVRLDPAYPQGLSLEIDGAVERCELWPTSGSALDLARRSGQNFAPLCDNRLALRSPAVGQRSTREAAVDFLRDRVWGGEQLTNFVKETLLQDADLATSELIAPVGAEATAARGPLPVAVDPTLKGRHVYPVNLGLPLLGADSGTVELGRWYEVEGSPGVYLAAIQPLAVDPTVSEGWGERVHPLDSVERSALVYLTAFDLDRFELAFDVGTDHPRAGWSERAPSAMRDSRVSGPDGFHTLDPLARIGKVNPVHIPRLVATFTGGFKRSHGAFRSGPLSQVNSGSHYGWVEHGVVESRPMPGLATWVSWVDGEVEVRVWEESDDALLWRVRHLRQNGPPLLVPEGETGRVVPGELVPHWSDGNWSGSVEGKLRSLRASLCVQESDRGSYLVYGYFSSHTPSSMARVLAASGCGVSMLTDMNALEHTYLSLHHFHSGEYAIHHLITGMEVLDRVSKTGLYLPRFVGLPDNRDFFTVLTRRAAP